jgi:mono/diheme cytochrome c family protein
MKLILVVMFAVAAPAQRNAAQPNLIKSVEGRDLFVAYCASCHGQDGRGSGPAAASLKVPPPDLTVIARKAKGKFPAERLEGIISGDETGGAHGSREMPVWGPLFSRIQWDKDLSPVRLRNLVKYIESIQRAR